MSVVRHTPGPWEVTGVLVWSPVLRTVVAIACTGSDEDTRDANACLMAAAPEMLELLGSYLSTTSGSDKADLDEQAIRLIQRLGGN